MDKSIKVVIITGASRGIGAASAILAAKKGYAVVVNYKSNKVAADKIVDTITSSGGTALAVAGDVSVEADVLQLFKTTIAQFGRLDALVNNAGILEHHMRLESMTVDRIVRVFNTNVIGSMLCAREAIRYMSTTQGNAGGSIVNLSSIAAQLGSPNEYIDYAASKGAIDTFTKGLAIELADCGVRVNAVRPGVIDTDIHASGGEPARVERVRQNIPMKRGGTSEEIANAVLWLLSSEASYVTGALIDVTGGR